MINIQNDINEVKANYKTNQGISEMDNGPKEWVVIDIETSGTDPHADQIIDIGFLIFRGTKLIKEYSSLVEYPYQLSSFIQKLTGITTKMLNQAPSFKTVEGEILDLYGSQLIAHNADFEASFLNKSFAKIGSGVEGVTYCDSLLYLGLLFPEYSSLKLENFIVDWGIADHEAHRGLADAKDLLKVLLVATAVTKMDKSFYQFIKMQIQEKGLDDFWGMDFLNYSDQDLHSLALQIDFDLNRSVDLAKKVIWPKRFYKNESEKKINKNFNLEFSGINIKNIFSDEEKIKTLFPIYRKRQSQIDLALKVGQSFKNNTHSLVQAPTGTGKTFGYLVPSILFALSEKKKVLIATGTKTLQHQAFVKDVPFVMDFLGLNENEFKIKLLVGSNNHLCESNFRVEENENILFRASFDFEKKFTAIYFEVIFFHNARLKSNHKILRDDLPYVLKRKILEIGIRDKNLGVDYRTCSLGKCPFKNNCSYMIALKEAKDADIIIGNHALMFTWPKGIPRPLNIVVDEAHKIEDEATSAFSMELDQIGFEIFVNGLQHALGVGSLFYLLAQNEVTPGESSEVIRVLREETLSAYQMITDHQKPLLELISIYFKRMPKYTELFWNELPMFDRENQADNNVLQIVNHLESIHFILKNYLNLLDSYAQKFDIENLNTENEITAFTRFESFFSQLSDYVSTFDNLLSKPINYCRSVKFKEDQGYLFLSSPIDIGKMVHENLLLPSASVVFTSATLANDNGDAGGKGIEWATGHSYLMPEKRFKNGTYLPPTYDYKKRTKVFLCDDGPSLYQAQFVEYHLSKIKPLIKKLNGKTLLLFSAKARFETAREILLKEFDGQIPVFIQGMGSNVVEDYKKSRFGILLGMESFGEGIDIPGDALQFIFIDKIPDLRMDLVVSSRREFFEANLGNEFFDYYLAHRTRSLHQKLGRLLRTENDYGGVIIVDNRVKGWKGKTMESLVKLMGPYDLQRAPLEESLMKLEEFILHTAHSTLFHSDHLNI